MTPKEGAYSEYHFFTAAAERAERAGRASEAAYYRYIAKDALDQLKREQEPTP